MTDLSNAIVVGVDGSGQALTAVTWSANAASLRNLSLHLSLSTEPYYRGLYAAGLPLPPDAFEEIDRLTRSQMREAAERAAAADPELIVRTERLQEAPVPMLLRMSKSARTIALGATGRGGFTGMMLGSTATAVAAHASCPVAVVREPETPDGVVVAGVDGSPTSTEALGRAFDEASWRRAKLVTVHAQPEPSIRGVGVGQVPMSAEETERLLAECLAGWQETYPDVHVDRVTVEGNPRSALLDWSAQAQLVVVGSRGRGGFRGLLLGSTSQALLQHAACPVLVVRPQTHL